ncbi:MAG: glyoxylate/hydroxypyruvate reductase A [Rhodobacteraceae bacterium]|nr:glyoxylate/hydroxypyruvate reductase A [Paracoccaceae bacterium]
MALLIDIGMSGWTTAEKLAEELLDITPGADIRASIDDGDPSEITMLATATLTPDLPAKLPGLKLVQKLGAGVDTIVNHPALGADVRVTRLKPLQPAQEIAEYCLAYVLRGQRNMVFHDAEQRAARWTPVEPREAHKTRVGVLGLGHIGGLTARLMTQMGYEVHGWARSPRQIEGVTCHAGQDALKPMLADCDYVCAILPSTAETRGLFDTDMLAAMKPGATLINAGRGDLVVEPALMAALEAGTPGHAVLDVVSEEPLPSDNPLWKHPGVTITPHVSGWHLGDALKDVAENFRRLSAGEDLLHEVDRTRGY